MNLCKKIKLFICMTSIFVLSLVAVTTSNIKADQLASGFEMNQENAEAIFESFIGSFEQIFDYDLSKEEYEYAASENSGFSSEFYSALAAIVPDEGLGKYKKADNISYEISEDDDSAYVVSGIAHFANEDVMFKFTVKYLPGLGQPCPLGVEASKYNADDESMSAKLSNALANTLMGMGTVFIVLIFISCIISLFKFIPKLLDREKKSKQEVVVNTTEEISDNSKEVSTNNTELVAVIAAAIAASEQVSTDSFVVRSIRRR